MLKFSSAGGRENMSGRGGFEPPDDKNVQARRQVPKNGTQGVEKGRVTVLLLSILSGNQVGTRFQK